MKKALLYLAFSILILAGILSYDIIHCDGQVILRRLSDYISSKEDDDRHRYRRKDYSEDYDSDYDDDYDDYDGEASNGKKSKEDIKIGFEYDDERGYEYYYCQLDSEEQQVYRSMYEAFSAIGSGNTIPTISDERMNVIANYIRMDHPEFFYVDIMGYTHYTRGGQIEKTVIAAKYYETKTVIKMELESINTVVDELINSFPENADDYTKVKLAYEWIIDNTDYKLDSENNQTIKSVFFNHKSVCAGYARALQYILNRAGVATTIVDGASLVTGESHAWNLCLVDGDYYYVDPTWGDASYAGKGYKDDISSINYDYLLVTSEELMRTHMISADLAMPICVATKDNYYIREDLYLDYYDETKIGEIFDRAYANNQKTISMKCGNLEIYDEVREYLIKDNGIFEYLRGDASTISYVEDEDQRTICFWL